jgi:hypothetical protein
MNNSDWFANSANNKIPWLLQVLSYMRYTIPSSQGALRIFASIC